MNCSKLRTFLGGGLWLARLDQFGDPLEATLPQQNLGLLYKLPSAQVPAVQKEYELGVKRAYASCWHMSDNDPSDHAWSFGCVALRTTPQKMEAALQVISGPDGPVHFGQIRYVDHWIDQIPEGNVIEAAFVVRLGFLLENEARVLVHAHGTAASDYLYGKKGPFGDLVRVQAPSASLSGKHEFIGGHANGTAMVLPIAPDQFIEEMVINSSASDQERNEIATEVNAAGFGNRLRVS